MKKSKGKTRASKKVAPANAGSRGGGPEYRLMTVALIREPEGADTMEVAFSESARFYRLSQANPEFEKILATLREAKEKNRPIYVLLESRHSDVIVDVKHSS